MAGLSAMLLPQMAWAQKKPVYFATEGTAIHGYDAVSYFAAEAPVPGQENIAVTWKGAQWFFATQQNRERFESNPRAYAPQFGGYCAYAMAHGALSSTDPKAWKIVDGRLYLTHSPEIERLWQGNVAENIRLAEEYWPAILYR